MHFLHFAILPAVALAALDGRCTGSQATGFWKESGICITTTNCSNRGGKTKNGACPSDPDNVKCCLIGAEPSNANPCGLYSHCSWRPGGSSCAGGTWITGSCPGPSNYQCCRIRAGE
ncbi:hypothetical protein F5X68DRAFT_265293 [Plectosphaerella plurivora]|uniref:Uncharacterized protein n=1 Tax=Plectosphaerella plurivora TaxID=936078 RepID=A0A9P8V387_9PEZI|nr:hypothetical protein F5X68DRAFT_265293 [Plectosphaerella plurivora]